MNKETLWQAIEVAEKRLAESRAIPAENWQLTYRDWETKRGKELIFEGSSF